MSENKNPLEIKKIEQIIRRRGFDGTLTESIRYHLSVLLDSKEEDEIETRQEMINYLFSKMFIDKMDLYPTQHFKCQVDENSDYWSLMPLPSELFGKEKQNEEERKQWFINTLNDGDILDCRVSVASPTACQLRVIHKYGVTRVLDDLNLMVVLCPTKNEVQLLEKELLACELVRVAVLKRPKDDDTIYVTVDKEAISFFKSMPKLGRITEEDLPAYVLEPPNTEKYSCYAEYLNSKPQFMNPYAYDNIISSFGINPKRMCSYYPQLNDREYPDKYTGQTLLKNSKLNDVKQLANTALKKLGSKKYEASLEHVEKGLKLCPKDDPLMSKLYDIRSDIYAEQAKPALSNKSLCDLEKACELNPSDEVIKQKLSHLIFKAANALYKDKNYAKAVFGLEMALKFDEKNPVAATLLNHIKEKHAAQLMELEERSIIDLQERKMKIISELNMIAA